MSEQIINVTAILVQQEIDNFFAEYPDGNPYKILFSLPYFQQQLLHKVLSQIPNHRLMTQDKAIFFNDDTYLNASLKEKEIIDSLILKNIPKILTKNYQKVGEILVKERSKTNLSLIWEDD
ncbi:hypothetical protein [Cyanothece sp. BG0011]|uniref:hypothetical protein n=1 Tax=Cyanothece sp. BG0011 TaxID=2082950 RepID=UPI000D1E6DDB|nr:hypothetical protein [Cyanothece sp. BG0011]